MPLAAVNSFNGYLFIRISHKLHHFSLIFHYKAIHGIGLLCAICISVKGSLSFVSVYKSELVPTEYKDTGRNLSIPSSAMTKNNVHVLMVKEEGAESKTITESVTNILAPAYAIVSGATQMIASIIQVPLAVATSATGEQSSSAENRDKGVSEEENHMQKLETGKEQRVFSQVNSEAISGRKVEEVGEKDAVEKVKEAVSSQQGTEEEPPKTTFIVNPHAGITFIVNPHAGMVSIQAYYTS